MAVLQSGELWMLDVENGEVQLKQRPAEAALTCMSWTEEAEAIDPLRTRPATAEAAATAGPPLRCSQVPHEVPLTLQPPGTMKTPLMSLKMSASVMQIADSDDQSEAVISPTWPG